jgi:hypothetical protein
MTGFSNMDDILFTDVEPVNGESKFGVITVAKAQVGTKPISGSFRIISQYK